MNVLRRLLVGATALSLLTVGTAAAAAHADVATTITSTVTVVGEAGTIAGDRALLWRSGVDTFTGGVTTGYGVSMTAAGAPYPDGDSFSFLFSPPYGQTLTVGAYENAGKIRTFDSPAIDVAGNGASCSGETGRFEVLDLDIDLNRFWIVYEQHCNNADAATFGEVRVNEPADADLLVTPRRITWPARATSPVRPTVPVTLVNTGNADVTVATATITGPGASQFSVVGNSCTTIAPGASCAIDVRDVVPAISHQDATLTITDSSTAGTHTVALQGSGLNPADPNVARTIGTAPGAVTTTGFHSDYGSLKVSWINPTDADWVETVVCGAPGRTPPSSPDCTPLYRGRDTEFTFADLMDPGATESLSFFAVDAEGLFTRTVLTVPGSTVTATANPSRLVWGKKFTITGELRDAITKAPLELSFVEVYAVDPYTGETFEPDLVRTGAGGKYSYTYNPGANYVWYVVFPGDYEHNGTISRALPVPVSKAITVKPARKTDALAHGITLLVGVDPLSPGTTVTVEELVKGKWKRVATKKLNKKSVARIKITPKHRGVHTYRVYAPDDRQSLGNTSKKVKVTVT